ncbi:hypothetical protein F7Q99_29415 [Streptomyces kaniharaensis]|uniref:Pectate lyase n=1 Tax=Streptomyces kaniharaensis TaxID=212423 RepID=A0A6N7L216_9ACTN|nr:hypothetical protein [Streptomyces kaniharaensis]MQS16234.1 hypothetical protein [Streptomyces kaniharaensis]
MPGTTPRSSWKAVLLTPAIAAGALTVSPASATTGEIAGDGAYASIYNRDADYNAGRWTPWGEVAGGATNAKAITATTTS